LLEFLCWYHLGLSYIINAIKVVFMMYNIFHLSLPCWFAMFYNEHKVHIRVLGRGVYLYFIKRVLRYIEYDMIWDCYIFKQNYLVWFNLIWFYAVLYSLEHVLFFQGSLDRLNYVFNSKIVFSGHVLQKGKVTVSKHIEVLQEIINVKKNK